MNINYLDSQCNEYINKLVKQRPDFDEEIFNSWLTTNDVENKTNPSAYVMKAFKKELFAGMFDKVVVENPVTKKDDSKSSVYVSPLLVEMRTKGIEIIQSDTTYIYVLANYLVCSSLISVSEISQINHDIVDIIPLKDTSDYIKELKEELKKRDIPVDYDFVQEEYERQEREWKEMIELFYDRPK